MDFALSTSWNATRHSEGFGLIKEISDAGFSEIELSFNLTPEITADIFHLAQQKKIKVVSLHNYCPIPAGLARENALPDVYSLASLNDEERQTAIHFTKKTIDCCAEFNARAVVLHCGYVAVKDATRALIELYSKGLKDAKEFAELKSDMIRSRAAVSSAYLAQAIKSLDDLNKYAKYADISLGIENRFYAREIPNLEETGIILKHFSGGNVFYWHDTGHAQVMENLGFVDSAWDFLKYCGKNLLGTHIHDVRLCRDHLAPLQGDLNLSALKPYLNDSTIKVIEAHFPATQQEIIKARNYLEKIFV